MGYLSLISYILPIIKYLTNIGIIRERFKFIDRHYLYVEVVFVQN